VKVLAKCVIAIAVVLIALAVVIGPGGVVAGAEYPLGVGPWSSTGHYCRTIDAVAQFGDRWKHSEQTRLTPRQTASWRAMEQTLTKTGPVVPRTDFTMWYRPKGDVEKTMESEAAQINTWWNQNCTDPMMEMPASFAHTWSGLASRATFTHYPKNVLHEKNFIKVIG
jgi:hypothetical protein